MTTVTVAAAGTAPLRKPSGHFDALDGVRGVAVLLVFCVHAGGNAAAVWLGVNLDQVHLLTLPTLEQQLLYWVFKSHHGVFVFFVLSGFLIGRMWWPRPVARYAAFAWRRTLRIYPAFLLAFAGSLVFAYGSGTWTPPDWPRLLGNALFLNGAPFLHVEALNVVTWSLFYEMSFYLAFPAFALAAGAVGARGGPWLWVAGVALPVVATAFGADPIVLCWSLLFVGVALAVHEDRLRALAGRLPSLAILALYGSVTTLALFELLAPTFAILAFGGATLLVIAKALQPGSMIAQALTLRPLRALGRISYSFYLVHWMPVVLVARATMTHAQSLSPFAIVLLVFGASFVAAVAVATALWWVAERPYFAWTAARRNARG